MRFKREFIFLLLNIVYLKKCFFAIVNDKERKIDVYCPHNTILMTFCVCVNIYSTMIL